MHQDLSGKHAFITGGGRGIGAACAQALRQRGASITIGGRDLETLAATAALLGLPPGAIQHIDVTDEQSVQTAMAAAAGLFGPIAILVNNAGQARPAPFLKTSSEHFQQMLDVNLTGAFHCTQAVLPQMLLSGWGRIVNVASTAGLKGYQYVSAYVAAKHGLIGLTRALALELATKGITVNAVCPGYTETDIVRDAIANIVQKTGRTAQQARAELAAANPQQQLIQVEQVASTVAWLCLPESSAMNGQSIAVAGGEVM
jgi:3-hydroxybutyrate dehydrogenase